MADEKKTNSGKILAGEKTRIIKIHREFGDKRTHQFVSIGDRNFMVKIGEEVEVPECVYNKLRYREQRMEKSCSYMEEVKKKS